jgi:hypothetical protein
MWLDVGLLLRAGAQVETRSSSIFGLAVIQWSCGRKDELVDSVAQFGEEMQERRVAGHDRRVEGGRAAG